MSSNNEPKFDCTRKIAPDQHCQIFGICVKMTKKAKNARISKGCHPKHNFFYVLPDALGDQLKM